MEIETLPILIKTKTWQNMFGVRRGNFRAYRKFCKRRNKKIRKSLKLSFGRKFAKDKFKALYSNPAVADSLTQTQGLQLVESILLMAEKSYVYYLESKSPTGNMPKKELKKKLRSALKFVDVILTQFTRFITARAKGELGIYRSFIASALFMERKRFREAKEELVQIIAVVGKLIDVVSAVERALLEEMLEAARQNLRYCKFQLKEFDRAEERDLAVIRNSEDVKELLDKVAKTMLVGLRTVPVFNKKVEIDDEQFQSVLNKEVLLKQNLALVTDEASREELFWELVNIYEEGLRICHKRKAEAGNNASLANIWSTLECLMAFQKNLMLFKRNGRLFRVYDNKFEAPDVHATGSPNLDRRPQESIKLLEILLVHCRTLTELLAKFGIESPLFTSLEKALRAQKCLFVCQLYNKNRCFKESLSLAEYQSSVLKEVRDSLRTSNVQVQKELQETDANYNIGASDALAPFAQATFDDIQRIDSRLRDLSKQAKVGLFDEGQETIHQLNENFEDLNLPKPDATSKNINCMMDLVLENRESKVKDQMDFIKLPPLGVLVPNKPIYLDLVWNFISYKDSPAALKEIDKPTDKEKPTKKGGFFGLFGR
jgi:hypothetical protein